MQPPARAKTPGAGNSEIPPTARAISRIPMKAIPSVICLPRSAYFSLAASSGFSSVACLPGAFRVGAAQRDQSALLQRAALAPCLRIGRDEVAKRRLGRQMLALQIDVELARARIGQVGDRRFGRRDAVDLDRADLVRILLEERVAEDADRARVGWSPSGRADCRSRRPRRTAPSSRTFVQMSLCLASSDSLSAFIAGSVLQPFSR